MTRLGRAARAAASAAGLAVVVVALPAFLVAVVGNPLPRALPSWAEAQTALADGWKPTDRFVLCVLALVLWGLWAQLMGHLYAEVRAHRARARQHPDGLVAAEAAPSAGRGPSRRLASWLVGGLMIAGPLAPTAAFGSAAPLPVVLATHATSPTPTPPAAPDATAPAAPTPAATPQYVVHTWAESKDCLWNIAERFLGDPMRWHEIEDLNEDVTQPSGRRLGDDARHWVYAGMVLRLPADATDGGRPLANRETIHPGQVPLVPASPAPANTPTAAAAASAETDDPATVVVRPGDSLWEIAEDELGAGEQYPGIWTANRGRVMEDGARFRDPDLIRPGWKLTVPGRRYTPPVSATTPPPPVPPASVAAAPPPPPAAPTANPPAAAQDAIGVVPDAQVPAANVAESTAAVPPSTVWPPPPAAVAAPPSTVAAPPVTAAEAMSPPNPAPPAAAEPPAPAAATAKESSGKVAPLPAGLLSGGLAAAAVVGLISRRRRRQTALRRPGRRRPLPTGEAARAETALRVGADPDGAALLADALAAVALAVDEDGGGLPEILGAHLTGDRVELLLASPPDEVPEPFEPSADGLRWTAPATDVAGFVATRARPCSPAPTMVTLGTTGTGTLTINLERIGLLALEGDPERAAGVLRRMAFELGAPFLAAVVNVVLVGLPEVAGLEDHVQTADTLGDALDRAASARWWGEDELAAHGAPSADAARAAGLNGDTWAPSVVLAAGPFTDEDLQCAAEVTADPARTAIAVVVATDRARTRWVLDLTDDLIDVGPLGLAVDLNDRGKAPTQVHGYDMEEAAAVSSVLATAARTDDVAPDDPPYDAMDDGWAWPTPATEDNADAAAAAAPGEDEDEAAVGLHVVQSAPDPEPTFEICVRVLGPIEVPSRHAKFPRGKASKELVIALALQPEGLTSAQVDGLLWPNRKEVPATRHSTVSAARAGLARFDGENLIPNMALAGGEARYRLDPRVGTDWKRFQWLTRNATGPAAAARLTEALELVRGEPLDGAAEWEWAYPYRTQMVDAVGDAAHTLAQLRLQAQDLPRATAAARAGLRASPWDQRLYGDLIEAADRAGNPAGVTALWKELVGVFNGEEDEITAEVADIYRRCQKRHAR